MACQDDALLFEEMPGDELRRRLFGSLRRINRGVCNRLRYLQVDGIDKEHHFVCSTQNGKVVGDLALRMAAGGGVLWLMHVTVDERFRRRGIASRLLEMAASHAVEHARTIEMSTYSDMGAEFLPTVVAKLRSRHPELEVVESMPSGLLVPGGW